MSTLSESVQRIYKFIWSPDPETPPAQSGIYLTRDMQGRERLRYFEARLGNWYMSWAELQTRDACDDARIRDIERPSAVVAWARRTRTLSAGNVPMLAQH